MSRTTSIRWPLRTACALAATLGLAARATTLYQSCQAQGLGQLDMSAIFKLLSEQPHELTWASPT